MAFETGSFFYAIFVCAERVLYDSSVWDIPRRSHCSLSTNDNPTKLNWQSMSKFMANVWLSILIVSMVQYIFHYKRICRIDLHVVWLWKTHKPQYHSGRFLFQLCTRALPHHLPPFHRSNEHNQFQHHTKFIQLENRLKHLFHVRQFLSFGDVACDIRNPDGCSQVTSQSFKSNWQSGIQSCVWVDKKKSPIEMLIFIQFAAPAFRRLGGWRAIAAKRWNWEFVLYIHSTSKKPHNTMAHLTFNSLTKSMVEFVKLHWLLCAWTILNRYWRLYVCIASYALFSSYNCIDFIIAVSRGCPSRHRNGNAINCLRSPQSENHK